MDSPLHTPLIAPVTALSARMKNLMHWFQKRIKDITELDPLYFERILDQIDQKAAREKDLDFAEKILRGLTHQKRRISYKKLSTHMLNIIMNDFQHGKCRELIHEIVYDLPPELFL